MGGKLDLASDVIIPVVPIASLWNIAVLIVSN